MPVWDKTVDVTVIANCLDQTPSESASDPNPGVLGINNFVYSTQVNLIKITGTEPLPYRIIQTFFAIFENAIHSLEPGEVSSNSAYV